MKEVMQNCASCKFRKANGACPKAGGEKVGAQDWCSAWKEKGGKR